MMLTTSWSAFNLISPIISAIIHTTWSPFYVSYRVKTFAAKLPGASFYLSLIRTQLAQADTHILSTVVLSYPFPYGYLKSDFKGSVSYLMKDVTLISFIVQVHGTHCQLTDNKAFWVICMDACY